MKRVGANTSAKARIGMRSASPSATMAPGSNIMEPRLMTALQTTTRKAPRATDAVPLAIEADARWAAAAVMGRRPDRTPGAGTVVRFAVGKCSLGSILVARSDKGICAILLGDHAESLERDLRRRFRQAPLPGRDADTEALLAKVARVVENPHLAVDFPLDVRGTTFQRRVWQMLRTIPAGSTVSYAEVARRIGAPRSVRAVAQACGANALAVAVPCHRVVRSDGTPSGYRWGADRKRALLEREARR